MPSDRFGVLHAVAVIAAGIPGLSAAVLATVALVMGEKPPRVASALGAAMLVFALLDFALYVSHVLRHIDGTPLVAAAQKVALLLLLAWMAAVALRVRDANETPPVP
jgi:hypothetical protein